MIAHLEVSLCALCLLHPVQEENIITLCLIQLYAIAHSHDLVLPINIYA